MRKADFAGLHFEPAAHKSGHGCRMMRVAERAHTRNRSVAKLAREALDHRDFERLARIERWEQAREPAREHRLARARRTDHQHVVAAGGRDLERALRGLLTFDVLEIRS